MAAVGVALCAAAAGAQELATSNMRSDLMRFGLVANAERIMHGGNLYVLVVLRAQQFRQRPVSRGNGVTEYKIIQDAPGTFSLEVACSAIAMEVAGTRIEAHALSPCRERARFADGAGMPVFVVFPYPAPGATTVTIPVTVLDALSPTTAGAGPAGSGSSSASDARPTGTHNLSLSVLIPEPKK